MKYWLLDKYQSIIWPLEQWWNRPSWVRVGATVCDCRCEHHVITCITRDGDVQLDDGSYCSIFACLDEPQVDGSCHTWALDG